MAAINAEQATKVGGNFVVNGRTYGSHDGTFFPISGPGLRQLNRGAYQALGVFNKFGDTPETLRILARMKGVGEAEVSAAREAWRASQ